MKDTKQNSKNGLIPKHKNYPTQKKPIYHFPSSIIFSLKPQWLIVPKDISPIAIFQETKYELSSTFPKLPKKLHLTPSSSLIRLNMISKIKSFIVKNNLSLYSFFLSIYYMDFILSTDSILPFDQIALGCLLLSVKFHEIDGMSPSISKFKDFNCNVTYSKEEIIQIEFECLKQLDHELVYSHSIHFINLLLLNGVIFNKDVSDNSQIKLNLYSLPSTILEYIIEDNGTYLQYDPLLLAFACVSLSREIYKFEKWGNWLESVYGVSFSSFEKEFEYAKSIFQRRKGQICSSSLNNKILIKDINKKDLGISELIQSTTLKSKGDSQRDINWIEKKGLKDILENNNKFLNRRQINYKSKSLQLNMTQFDAMVIQPKVNKKEYFNPIKGISDSSTAEDSTGLRNTTKEYKQKDRMYIDNLHYRNGYYNGYNKPLFSSTQNLDQKEVIGKVTSCCKLQNVNLKLNNNMLTVGNNEHYDEKELLLAKTIKNKDMRATSKGIYSYQTYTNNYDHKRKETIINMRSKNNKRETCISLKHELPSNNSCISSYNIKDLTKLITIKKGLNYPIQLTRKNY